jgi:hypothetical protein
LRFFSTGSRRAVAFPPADSIFSRAVFEKRCAVTVSFFFRSPSPRIFTSVRVFLITRFATSVSGVTSSPASKRSRSRRLTGCVEVRNGPIGIASAEVAPRSLPSRM